MSIQYAGISLITMIYLWKHSVQLYHISIQYEYSKQIFYKSIQYAGISLITKLYLWKYSVEVYDISILYKYSVRTNINA